MTNYSEALEQQLSLYDWMKKKILAKGRGAKGVDAILRGDPYYVSDPIGKLLVDASISLNGSTVLQVDDLPSTHGFVWLGGANVGLQNGDKVFSMKSLLWMPRPDFKGSVITAVCAHDERSGGIPLLFVDWAIGESLEEAASRLTNSVPDGAESAAVETLALFYTFCAFVKQRILTASPEAPDRATRRRLNKSEHADRSESLIRVVQLRRSERQTHSALDSDGVEWACQWIVKGHWHKYHHSDGVRSQWILPYVKGPEDKPLKSPGATVFAVVR